jgi:hypothetical protein
MKLVVNALMLFLLSMICPDSDLMSLQASHILHLPQPAGSVRGEQHSSTERKAAHLEDVGVHMCGPHKGGTRWGEAGGSLRIIIRPPQHASHNVARFTRPHLHSQHPAQDHIAINPAPSLLPHATRQGALTSMAALHRAWLYNHYHMPATTQATAWNQVFSSARMPGSRASIGREGRQPGVFHNAWNNQKA